MNMFRAFMELDKLTESVTPQEGDRVQMDYYAKPNNGAIGTVIGRIGQLCWVSWEDGSKSKEITTYLKVIDSLTESNDRQALIDKIKSKGKKYNFDRFSTDQLFKINQRLEAEQAIWDEANRATQPVELACCDFCGTRLTDGGFCPVCDDGEEDYLDETDTLNSFLHEWVYANSTNQAQSSQSTQVPKTANKNVVEIFYDYSAHKLRARADDGVHGKANVAFPNSLRNKEGQQYEVDQLIWNGKNYRVSGDIKPI